ncbi:MAG: YARHG domain-containing protein [Myxococcota bacterium]
MLALVAALAVSAAPEAPDWIKQRPITWNAEREQLTLAYRKQRFGEDKPTTEITPTMVIIHHTAIDSLEESFKTFDPPRLPASRGDIAGASALNVSAHFLIDQDGTVYQLLPANRMARHTIGLNWTAIGIENVGGNRKKLTPRQLEANARLVRYLKASFPSITMLLGHHEYQGLRRSALWHERDALYVTPKLDPGEAFMSQLRRQVKELGLTQLPPDVTPKVDFTQGSPRRYEAAELAGKSLRELSLLRNEIFARHGWAFNRRPYLRNYFTKQAWYRVNPAFTSDLLTDLDRANLELIERAENAVDPAMLRILRNTVFARHGRKFESPDLAEYFAKQPWYKPDAAYSDSRLTEDDKFEIELIQEFERRAATVPSLREWKPGRKLDPAALEGADLYAVIDFYEQVNRELRVALAGAPCLKDGRVDPSAVHSYRVVEPTFCEQWAKGRPVEQLPAVDQATILTLESAIAIARLERWTEPSCEERCAMSSDVYAENDEELASLRRRHRGCLTECAKTINDELKTFRTDKKARLDAIRRGEFARGWEASDPGPPSGAA